MEKVELSGVFCVHKNNEPIPDLMLAYQGRLKARGWRSDLAQEAAVTQFQVILSALIARQERSKSFLGRAARFFSKSFGRVEHYEPMVGLYLWGGVGRGKTFLMDLFYEHCPLELKLRSHYHRFMREVHQELSVLQGHKNPLELVADRIARRAMVLCLDEFFVKDIGDAMILANLLRALFERGVVLVATSNVIPEKLYADGLQRDRFVPAIKLINHFTLVSEFGEGVDFRLQTLADSTLYCLSSNKAEDCDQVLSALLKRLAPEAIIYDDHIKLCGRAVPIKALSDDVVWFEFEALCGGPRSVSDYIELAEDYTTVFVSSVPIFEEGMDDSARRFIHLIDELYDRRVKLILSAAARPEHLYKNGQLTFEFARTVSRLLEMQSEAYLSCRHE